MLGQTLYEVVASLLPDCVMGMDIISDWEMCLLPSIVKQKAHLSSNVNWMLNENQKDCLIYIMD